MALEHVYKMLLDGSEGRLVARIAPEDVDYLVTMKAAQEPGWVVITNPSFAAPDFTLEKWSNEVPFNNRFVRNERG